jgi:hypothetical protein
MDAMQELEKSSSHIKEEAVAGVRGRFLVPKTLSVLIPDPCNFLAEFNASMVLH